MSSAQIHPFSTIPIRSAQAERARNLLLRCWILAGLFFMAIPGTLLGFSNLLSISSHHGLSMLSSAWIEGHGHAQVFGWMGSFILGIGFYSFPQNRLTGSRLPWVVFSLWVVSVAMRWVANVYFWQWRILLPLTATLEFVALLLFLRIAATHKRTGTSDSRRGIEPWMICVLAGNAALTIALGLNMYECFRLSLAGIALSFPHLLDQRYLVLLGWGFLVPTVWGFSARWLPGLIHTKPATPRKLRNALILNTCGVLAGVYGETFLAGLFFLCGAFCSAQAIHIFEDRQRIASVGKQKFEASISFSLAYLWLLIASTMSIWAALKDVHGGIWGASRHALTVGFAATMVMSVGPRVLPHFAGVRGLFSKKLMVITLTTLSSGCTLRVLAEPIAYEGYSSFAWKLLPFSGAFELLAVILFAFNIGLTFLLAPPAVPITAAGGNSLGSGIFQIPTTSE